MPRKTKDGLPFDQSKYVQEWSKENMKTVNCKYKAEFVDEFKEACRILKTSQSDVIRQAMIETIEKSKKIKE